MIMLEFAPVLLALILVLFFFGYTFSKGVVGVMGSGLAALSAMVIFFASVNLLPLLASKVGDVDLTWKITLAISGVFALFTYIIGFFIFRGILKAVFNPDSWLHSFSDGIAGGILSIFPSIVAILFLFTCIRIVGTVQELNYAASISQDGIERMGGRVPEVPMMVDWRNGIERLPLSAMAMDLMDPFSNRQNRKSAAFLMMTSSGYVRSFLLSREDTRPIASSVELSRLRGDVELRRSLESQDRLGVVLNRKLQEFGKTSPVADDISKVQMKDLLEDFVDSLPKNEIPPAQSAG